jgi:hypothetical protein
VKLRLILDVDYEPNGVPKEDLVLMLESVARQASHGLLTQDTPAEVNEWDYRVEETDQ